MTRLISKTLITTIEIILILVIRCGILTYKHISKRVKTLNIPGVGVAIAIAFTPVGVVPDGVKPPGVNPPGVDPPGVVPPGVRPPGVPLGVIPLGVMLPAGVESAGVAPPGVSSQRVRRLLVPGVGVSVIMSAPVLSVWGVSAQPPPCPGVSVNSIDIIK